MAASLAYSRRFGNQKPNKIKDKKTREAAYEWLSRGLEEAIINFIGQANGNKFALRAAVYEFSQLPVLKAFGKAARKADVEIIYDRRKKRPFEATERAVKKVRIKGVGRVLACPQTGSRGPGLVDTEVPFKNHWILHPGMNGRSSIKAVLSTLVPDLTYDDLAIQDGLAAAISFQDIYERSAAGDGEAPGAMAAASIPM